MRKGIGIGCGALVVLLVIIVAVSLATSGGGNRSTSSKPAATAQTTHTSPPQALARSTTPKPTPPPAQPRVLLDLQGSGIKSSPPFDAPGHWKLSYNYDCSGFAGGQGNFQVYVYQGSSPADVAVNELGGSGSSSTDVYTGGQVHLEVNSECNWHVTATTA